MALTRITKNSFSSSLQSGLDTLLSSGFVLANRYRSEERLITQLFGTGSGSTGTDTPVIRVEVPNVEEGDMIFAFGMQEFTNDNGFHKLLTARIVLSETEDGNATGPFQTITDRHNRNITPDMHHDTVPIAGDVVSTLSGTLYVVYGSETTLESDEFMTVEPNHTHLSVWHMKPMPG